jgi:hypothetical protein
MEKEFVPYELALKMKQLGFDEPCITFYPVNLTQPLIGDYATLGLNGKYSSIKDGYRNSVCLNQLWKKRYKQDYANVAAPTYSQTFRWFREKYGLYSVIDGLENRQYYKVTQLNTYSKEYNTYEEAELGCLVKLIDIIENK